MLLPTKEQEELFWKSVGAARWAYNYFLAENDRVYRETKKTISGCEVRKQITILKKTTHTWLKEVGSNVVKMATMDAERALRNYLNGLYGKPHFKTKRNLRQSFYVNYESIRKTQNGFRGEKIGFIKTVEPLPKLRDGQRYSYPRIIFDGKYWYLSIGYEVEEKKYNLTDKSIGIDLGVKELAVCSDGTIYGNINKTKKVRRIKKRLAHEQRKLSRMRKSNIKGYTSNRKPIYEKPLEECKNYQKQRRKVAMIQRRLNNIRNNYLHQVTTEIVNKLPYRIVMETLNIRKMMKNKHLARRVAEQSLYEFKRKVIYKAEMRGIKIVEVPTFYPSSKTCSCCGYIKRDLQLSDREYICPICSLKIDRDLNASINLANYKTA